MKAGVIQFPGSNCDQDALFALRNELKVEAEYVWHDSKSLKEFDAIFVPGGFSYGDYLRCGAIAAQSPIMDEIKRAAGSNKLVIGVCNGFQILCESGLLPGALFMNRDERFICEDVFLKAENRASPWTQAVNKIIKIPIAHGDGRYVVEEETVRQMESKGQIAFRYVDANGERTEKANVNGSVDSIAGVLNENGNVIGMMPHPERAVKESFGYGDGMLILKAFQLVHASA